MEFMITTVDQYYGLIYSKNKNVKRGIFSFLFFNHGQVLGCVTNFMLLRSHVDESNDFQLVDVSLKRNWLCIMYLLLLLKYRKKAKKRESFLDIPINKN